MKSLAVTAIFSLAAAIAPISAQTIEVALLESSGDRGPGATRSSELVIAGALDGLFGSGFIGTNSRPAPGDRAAFDAYTPGPYAAEGRIDYVIVLLAEYRAEAPVPHCSYRLVRVSDGKELARGEAPALKPASSSSLDIDRSCSAVGALISAECGGVLRGSSASRREYRYEEA